MGARCLDLHPTLLAQLVALSELGGLQGAADALECMPSALARSIADLERATGQQLLVSEAETQVLSPAGERVAESARAALIAIDRFRAAADDDRSTLRVAHVANADTLSVLLEQSGLSLWTRVSELVVADHQQLSHLRAFRLDVAVCTAVTDTADDLMAVPLRLDPLLKFGTAEGCAAQNAAVAPLYGHAWRAHDELVDAYARREGCPVERVQLPLGSGRERAAMLRAARGRALVVAASAAQARGGRPGGELAELALQWQLVWRRDDPSALVHEFVAAARDLSLRQEWLEQPVASSDPESASVGAA